MSGCHHPSVRELDKDLYFLMLLLMTQAICLRCILLPPFFHDLPMWSRACFWVVRIMLPSLHSLQLLCFAMFCAERKGGKKDSKTGNDCSSSKLGKDLAESRCSYFFLLTFSYSLCFTQSVNDKNNNRKTILDLLIAFNVFSVPTGNINIFWLLTWE